MPHNVTLTSCRLCSRGQDSRSTLFNTAISCGLKLTCVCERFVYSQDWSTYFPAAGQADRSWKYINLAQIYECKNCETEHYNFALEITASFLGIQKWEPDIYIGFSSALHLQCSWPMLFFPYKPGWEVLRVYSDVPHTSYG
jgi:hypothetical protein